MELGTIALVVNIIISLILFWTLFEIRAQRLSMYVPELLIKEKMIEFHVDLSKKYFNVNTLPYPAFDSIDEIIKGPDKYESDNYLEIHNIGLGTAKNVEVEFSFNIWDFIELIKELDTNKIFEIKEIGNGFTITVGKTTKGKNILFFLNKDKNTFNYVYLKNNNEVIFPMPPSFITLYGIYWALVPLDSNTSFKSLIKKLPRVRIDIKYKDISNRDLTKVFFIESKVLSSSRSPKISRISFSFFPVEEKV